MVMIGAVCETLQMQQLNEFQIQNSKCVSEIIWKKECIRCIN